MHFKKGLKKGHLFQGIKEIGFGAGQVFGGVDSYGPTGGGNGLNGQPGFKPAKLLEALGSLKRRLGKTTNALQRSGPIGIDTHMGLKTP